MSPLIVCLFSWNIFAATPVQERMILPKNSILFFFWCVWFLTPKTFFRTVFSFSEQKKPPVSPRRGFRSQLPFRFPPRPWRTWYLEPANFQRWDDVVTYDMAWLSVTVVIQYTSDLFWEILLIFVFLLSLRCDMQGVHSDSFSWDMWWFALFPELAISGSVNAQSHCLLRISSQPIYKLQGSKWNHRISRKSRCWRETFEFPRIEMPETLWAMQLSQF